MTNRPDEDVLDDVARLTELDPDGMLPTVAGSAGQIREALTLSTEAGLEGLRGEDLPRSVVVVGMGGSAVSGDVLAAVAGPQCPVPVLVHRGYDLPRWVGAADLVVAVSCSGTTEETVSALEAAARRGARLLGVAAANSPVASRVRQARGLHVPVPAGRMPRASLWALATPLVVAGDALGLLSCSREDLEATARQLESIAGSCAPAVDSVDNPAKSLALSLAATLPMAWGCSPVSGVAAARFATQLNENAKYPAISGVLPEANHNQVVALDGPYAALADGGSDDLFRDRVDDPDPVRLSLLLLRDDDGEHPQVTRRAEASRELAQDRGVVVRELAAQGATAYERLASLVGVIDWASAYLGLLHGLDPTPIQAIATLKARIGG